MTECCCSPRRWPAGRSRSVLVGAARLNGAAEVWRVGLGLASVVLSWAMVHTIYTLRYAHLYYKGPDGGIGFNDSGRPTYADFAYLAFTIGMTFQVSDTAMTSRAIRQDGPAPQAAVVRVRHGHRGPLDQLGGQLEQQVTRAVVS